MASPRKFASDAAEKLGALATSPGAIPVIAVGVTAAAAAIGGVLLVGYIRRKIHAAKVKKHRDEIEAVNAIGEKYLARIQVPGFGMKSLPPIFKLTPDINSDAADALHFSVATIKSQGETEPLVTDPALSKYTEYVLNAINELKTFYFDRLRGEEGDSLEEKKNDVLSTVISYLLYILDNHCLHFEGYDYDIAYLDAITNFIRGYASLEQSKNTPSFSNLNDAFESLSAAKIILVKHKESLGIEDTIGDLKTACAYSSKKFIRIFNKILIDKKYWPHMDMVDIEELAIGRIQKAHVRKKFWKIVLHNKEKFLDDSVMKDWGMDLAKYYLKIIDPSKQLNKTDVSVPEKMFHFVNVDELKKLKDSQLLQKSDEKNQLNKIEETLKKIRQVFKKSENFITRKIDEKKTSDIPVFIPITDDYELIERVKVLSSFATLAHLIISLQYLCMHLLSSIKQLGEIYINDPNNFCKIFVVLDELCMQVKSQVKSINDAMTDIQSKNQNAMQLEEVQEFENQIKTELQTVSDKMTTLSDRVKKHREKAQGNPHFREVETQKITHAMYKAADLMVDLYGLKVSVIDAGSPGDANSNHKPGDNIPQPPIDLLSPSPEKIPATSSAENSDARITGLIAYQDKINSRIAIISGEDKAHTNEISTYVDLQNALHGMQVKVLNMARESSKSVQRNDKADKTIDLLLNINNIILKFLMQDRQNRINNAGKFANNIHAALDANKTAFIDWHTNPATERAYSLSNISLFRTDSRKKLAAIEEICDCITKILGAKDSVKKLAAS